MLGGRREICLIAQRRRRLWHKNRRDAAQRSEMNTQQSRFPQE